MSEDVAGRIRAAISDGRYPPNTRLVERRIAAELGVSHIPVREALARLVDEGLVEHQPRRGARVAGLTPLQVEEIASLRTLLEEFVVVRVQQRMTPAVKAELQRVVDAMVQAAERGNSARVLELDQRFHERLWALADHAMLVELVGHLRGRLAAFLRSATTTLDSDGLVEHARSHQLLLDTIAGGKPAAAKRAMAAHVAIATDRVLATLTGDA